MVGLPSFHDVVHMRRSARQFLPTPLTPGDIAAILADAQRAPSNCNTQPWIVHIVSGGAKAELTKALVEHADNSSFSPDFSWDEKAFPEVLDERRREQGKMYYEALGIARGDLEGRREALLRNLNFFNAPHAAFLFMPSVGDNVRVAADLGMYAQTFLLSLTARGFAGIPQTLLGLFGGPVRSVLGIPDNMKLLFGISFGYADPLALQSAPYMGRAPIGDSVVLHN